MVCCRKGKVLGVVLIAAAISACTAGDELDASPASSPSRTASSQPATSGCDLSKRAASELRVLAQSTSKTFDAAAKQQVEAVGVVLRRLAADGPTQSIRTLSMSAASSLRELASVAEESATRSDGALAREARESGQRYLKASRDLLSAISSVCP